MARCLRHTLDLVSEFQIDSIEKLMVVLILLVCILFSCSS